MSIRVGLRHMGVQRKKPVPLWDMTKVLVLGGHTTTDRPGWDFLTWLTDNGYTYSQDDWDALEITTELLGDYGIVFINFPHGKSSDFSQDEKDAVEAHVTAGASLAILCDTDDDHDACAHINQIANLFGFGFDLKVGLNDFSVQYKTPLPPFYDTPNAVDSLILSGDGVPVEVVMRTGTATCSSGSWCSDVNDGNEATYWLSGKSATAHHWVYIDLGEAQTVNKVRVKWSGTYYSAGYSIQKSPDASTWTDVLTGLSGAGGGWKTHTFPAASARYWRIYSVKTDETNNPRNRLLIYEVELSAPRLDPARVKVAGWWGAYEALVVNTENGGVLGTGYDAMMGTDERVENCMEWLKSPVSCEGDRIDRSYDSDGYNHTTQCGKTDEGNTYHPNGLFGYLWVKDAWDGQYEKAWWIWDFITAGNMTYHCKWKGILTAHASYAGDAYFTIYVSLNGTDWTQVHQEHLTPDAGEDEEVALRTDEKTGNYRYVKAELYSVDGGMAIDPSRLYVDGVWRD